MPKIGFLLLCIGSVVRRFLRGLIQQVQLQKNRLFPNADRYGASVRSRSAYVAAVKSSSFFIHPCSLSSWYPELRVRQLICRVWINLCCEGAHEISRILNWNDWWECNMAMGEGFWWA